MKFFYCHRVKNSHPVVLLVQRFLKSLQRGLLMVDTLLITHSFYRKLFCAAVSLMFWTTPSFAAQLKDIRLGEHNDYTRIVFEFDQSVQSNLVQPDNPHRLEIEFPDTRPNLVQKIPVERAKHLKDIQIWSAHNALSAVLKFNLTHKKVDTFALKEPPRIIVDIYWQTPATQPAKTSLGQRADAPLPDTADALLKEQESGQTPASTTTIDKALESEPHNQPLMNTETLDTHLPDSAGEPDKPSPEKFETPPPPNIDSTPSAASVDKTEQNMAPVTAPTEPTRTVSRRGNWLQYYLVIALVIITVGILVLLVMMLLTRYRWVNEDPPLSTSEFLKLQDERLSKLDARIKEQLKRYDNA